MPFHSIKTYNNQTGLLSTFFRLRGQEEMKSEEMKSLLVRHLSLWHAVHPPLYTPSQITYRTNPFPLSFIDARANNTVPTASARNLVQARIRASGIFTLIVRATYCENLSLIQLVLAPVRADTGGANQVYGAHS
jgi:hypothetical protein